MNENSAIVAKPARQIDAGALRRSFADIDVPDLPDIPGMIKFEEGQYLYWLARYGADEGADIAEVGTWLGRSTSFLAAGLADRSSNARLVCFDHYEWAGGANWASKTSLKRERGEDFMPDFLDNLKPFASRIDARKSKIDAIDFDGMTIGALALDAPKRTRDIVAIYKKLAGRILPGQTVLAWQDFLHPASFEIPACLGMLTRLQTPVHVVSTGTLVGLQIDANWSEADIDEDRLNFRNWSKSDAEDIWQYWAPLVPDRETASFESGLCMLLHDLGRVDEARKRIVPLLKDDLCLRRWKKWLPTSLSDKYKPLFELV